MKKFIAKKHMQDFKHPLVTRRDFLTHGVLAFGAIAAMPKIFGMRSAFAASAASMCGGGAEVSTLSPFVAFDMAGGGSLPGNFLVGGRGGPKDLLKSYDTLGWDPKESGSLNESFGLPMSAKRSQILAGILQSASAGARANLRMGSICHRAEFDSSNNQLNAGTLVLKAGNRGAYITNGIGTKDSMTGGNSSGPQTSALYKPVFVQGVDDILGSTNFGGAAFDGYGVNKMGALAQGAVDLSTLQKQAFSGLPGGGDLGSASECAYAKTLDFISGVQGLNPLQDPIAQGVYNLNAQSDPRSMNAVVGGLVMNSVNGYAGPSTFTLGNCDYHTGNASDGDAQDLAMGIQIGLAVEYAFQKQRPLFFQLLTDGGNSAEGGSRDWSADDPDRCMTVMGFFDPKGPPKMRSNVQIGQYTEGQGADPKHFVGNDPTLVSYAVFANYLALHGKLGEFATLAPGIFTGAGELDSVLVFDGKA